LRMGTQNNKVTLRTTSRSKPFPEAQNWAITRVKHIRMENIIKKLESAIDGYVKNLQNKPIKTGLVTLFIYWLVKKLYTALKND
jgi:hypothetical protein